VCVIATLNLVVTCGWHVWSWTEFNHNT